MLTIKYIKSLFFFLIGTFNASGIAQHKVSMWARNNPGVSALIAVLVVTLFFLFIRYILLPTGIITLIICLAFLFIACDIIVFFFKRTIKE